jgi:hypothetical protein
MSDIFDFETGASQSDLNNYLNNDGYDFFADPRNDPFYHNDLGPSPSNADILSDINYDPGILSKIGSILSGGSGTMAQLAGLGGLGALINKIGGSGGSGGGGFQSYQGGIPELTASRTQLPIPPSGSQSATPDGQGAPKRRPGSGGVTYFSPMQYLKPGQAPASSEPVGRGLGSLIGGVPGDAPSFISQPGIAPQIPGSEPPTPGQVITQDDPFYQSAEFKAFQNDPSNMMGTDDMYMSPYFGQQSSGSVGRAMDRAYEKYKGISPRQNQQIPVMFNDLGLGSDAAQYRFAQGGITNLGGYSDGGRLLKGPGDGVSDDIPAMIGDKQPARLADGEFVVPARIVSELGNGSTEAGARKLYAMMDRVQKARGKTLKNVAANSKADKYLPA